MVFHNFIVYSSAKHVNAVKILAFLYVKERKVWCFAEGTRNGKLFCAVIFLWLVANNFIAFTMLLKLLWNVNLSLVLEYVVHFIVVIFWAKLKYFLGLLISKTVLLKKVISLQNFQYVFLPKFGLQWFSLCW